MDPEVTLLLEQIHEAFRDVPRGDLSMHQAHIVKWADEDKLRDARARDHDQHWTDITDETIEEARNALYGADPVSWRYFLPAYLSWTLRHFQRSDSFIVDQTIYTFQPYKTGEPLRQDSELRFDTLSLPQKRVICVFLRYMAGSPDHCDAEVAWRSLEMYWGQFCP